MSSLVLALKGKASTELLVFQKRFLIFLFFAISGIHLTIEVSYAGFAKFFVAMIMFWWMDIRQINLQ